MLQKLHSWLCLIVFDQNITQVSSEYHPKDARYVPKMDQGPSESKGTVCVQSFVHSLKKHELMQSDEGRMHKVCEVATQISEGVPWTG